MITDPRSSPETKSSRKESSFSAEIVQRLIDSRRPVPRKFVALYHRNTKIRMRYNEHSRNEHSRNGHSRNGHSRNGHSRKRTAIIKVTFTKLRLSQLLYTLCEVKPH